VIYALIDSDSLTKLLSGGALHGDMLQGERDKVLREFKNNKFPILVATDVAGKIIYI
jgi:superfamily II DNA/RNA helicase